MACVLGDLREEGVESELPNSTLPRSCTRSVGRPTSTSLRGVGYVVLLP